MEWDVTLDLKSKEPVSGFYILLSDPSVEKPTVHWRWPKVGINKIVEAKAKIIGSDTLEVWSDEITDAKQIKGLRNNMSQCLTGNLYNREGLPAYPFMIENNK